MPPFVRDALAGLLAGLLEARKPSRGSGVPGGDDPVLPAEGEEISPLCWEIDDPPVSAPAPAPASAPALSPASSPASSPPSSPKGKGKQRVVAATKRVAATLSSAAKRLKKN